MKGSAVENLVTDFLRDQLPDNFGFSSGIIIDSNLKASKQVDIIIYDKSKTPRFFSAAGMSLIPVECVYFAIEVKTKLTSRGFSECIQNMKSVKALERTAYYSAPNPIETKFSYFGRHFSWQPTVFLVFCLEGPSSDELIRYQTKHHDQEEDPSSRIDAVFCLDVGLVCNYREEGKGHNVDLLPSEGRRPYLIEENRLLTFLTLFSRYFNQAQIPKPIDLSKYTLRHISKEGLIHNRGSKPTGNVPNWQHPKICFRF